MALIHAEDNTDKLAIDLLDNEIGDLIDMKSSWLISLQPPRQWIDWREEINSEREKRKQERKRKAREAQKKKRREQEQQANKPKFEYKSPPPKIAGYRQQKKSNLKKEKNNA